jgi:site-specific DNA-methyltransferase (adenine-specific)
MRKEIIGDCTLYLGDANDLIPTIDADRVVCDPPYGVGLGEVVNGQSIAKDQKAYGGFSDTPEYIKDNIIPIFDKCIGKYKSVAATTGNRNMWLYPKPDDFGVWYNPAGTSRGKWGYNLVVTPILYWGKDPRAGKGSTASSCWGKSDSVADVKKFHPCPKPLLFMKWFVEKCSLEGETVLDPFMGSGTTALACITQGRKFTGIEIDADYFDLSCRRIEEAYRQPDMFIEPPAKIIQESFLD